MKINNTAQRQINEAVFALKIYESVLTKSMKMNVWAGTSEG